MNRDYHAAAHAMQSGVAAEMGQDEIHGTVHAASTPKHLRVGINAAMSDHAGLAALLIDKGLITREEYIQAITASMNDEVYRYEAELSERLGTKVTLA